MLMTKALKIAMKLNLADSGFTTRSLQKSKVCHEISCHIVSGKFRNVPVDTTTKWIKILIFIVSEYEAKTLLLSKRRVFLSSGAESNFNL